MRVSEERSVYSHVTRRRLSARRDSNPGPPVIGPAEDIDIAIPKTDLETYSEVLTELALWLGVNEDFIDLVEVGPETPCPLVLEALLGVPLYVEDWDLVFRLFNVCQDWEIDARKLQLHEILVARWRA